jgi:hypothetical protein
MHMSISRADMLQYWPEDQLLRWQPDQVAALGLSAEALHVLCEVGLPARIEGLGFEARPPRLFVPRTLNRQLCRIGLDPNFHQEGDFSVDPATGHVWAYTDTDARETAFVNTTLTQFAQSLHAIARLAAAHLANPDDSSENLEYLAGLANQALTAIDRRAMEEEDESYWAIVVELAEGGGY